MALLGITLGDVNGIGPEVAVKAAEKGAPGSNHLILIGDAGIITAAYARLRKAPPPVWQPGQRPAARVMQWSPSSLRPLKRNPGASTVSASRAAYAWLEAATDLALKGTLKAIITAPINKAGFQKAGIDVQGHTELLADWAKVKHVDMMLCSGDLRVVLATRHVPLRQVADTLSRRGLRATITMTAQALDWFGARRKRIAVCGLNPHAGDGGAFGDEERTIITPAIKQVQWPGATVLGPVPSDTVFHQVQQGAYDAVVAMYHDQGLAPFKMVAFDTGVNVTLGLPFVRTSPDHGTAYHLAGQGVARADSMRAAIEMAARLVRRPNPWHSS